MHPQVGGITAGTLDIACIFATLIFALIAGLLATGASRSSWRWPWITGATLVVTGLMMAAISRFPQWLPALQRDPILIGKIELWRAVTALFAQDPGLAGGIFNLTILLLLGVVAEQRLGWRRWLVIYLGAGIATEFLALVWQSVGSGNSIAVFGLAGALCMIPFPRRAFMQCVVRVLAMASGAGLLAVGDIHGIGFWTGAAIAAALTWRRQEAA